MKVLKSDKMREYRRNRQVVGVEKVPEPAVKPVRNHQQEQTDALKQLTIAIRAMIEKPHPVPIVNLKQPDIKVNVPSVAPPKGWKFKARKTGDEWDIMAERIG